MSLAFLPLIYIAALWVRYEGLFLRLSFFIKDRALLNFAKRQTLLKVNFHLNLLNRWAREMGKLRLESRRDILEGLASTKAQWTRAQPK